MSIRHIRESLAGKLVVVLGLLLLVGSGVFWYASVWTDKRNLMNNAVVFVSSFSEVVRSSLRQDMLLFRRDDIQRTIEHIGDSEAIRGVRIFDSKGVVFYSSEPGEVGTRAQSRSASCVGCHSNPQSPRETLTEEKRWTVYDEPGGPRVLNYVEPIYNEPECFNALCHAHDPGRKVLGILATEFSLAPIDAMVKRQMLDTSIYVVSFLILSTALLWFVLWRLVLRPVGKLSEGMVKVSSGDLLHKVNLATGDELGRLGGVFNEMTVELSEARRKMESWAQSLEEEVARKTEEIRRTQDKLVQAEKLAALGRLTADIAHEIRNPLTGLGGFGRRLLKIAGSEREREYAEIVVSEVDRLEMILKDVLTFSRDAAFRYELMSLTSLAEDSMSVYREICRERSIEVMVSLDTESTVLIDREQVVLAFNNLLSNAVDAMPEGGTLTVDTHEDQICNVTFVVLMVRDTGPGVPEESLPLIFEPFHTTKPVGKGTGLGLSITRKIIEKHGGFVFAENLPERGFSVSLYFPFQSEEELRKTPCWEYMKCGRESGEVSCPAYPNFGRVCWVVAGTFCEGKVQGEFAKKYEDCRKCEFFRELNKGEC